MCILISHLLICKLYPRFIEGKSPTLINPKTNSYLAYIIIIGQYDCFHYHYAIKYDFALYYVQIIGRFFQKFQIFK